MGNRIRKIDPAGNVTTLAGNGGGMLVDGTGGWNGTAQFSHPEGVAVDSSGNVFVADSYNNAIRKIDAAGNVTTVAGDGQGGWVDGPRGSAEFMYPRGVAVDPRGNIYVADTENNRIRKIDPAGNVSTLAGNGAKPQGDPSAALPFAQVADGTGGPEGTAEFSEPRGVAVDAQSNVYVADFENNRIRKIDAMGNVTTLCGPSILTGPYGVAVDGQGNVYILDTAVRRLDPSGNLTTIVDGGNNQPWVGLAADPRGAIYVTGNNRVEQIGNSGQVTILAGRGTDEFADGTGGHDGTAQFDGPFGLAADDHGNVYVADMFNDRIRRIDTAHKVTTMAGTGAPGWVDGPAAAAEFNQPSDVAIDTHGNLYVADAGNRCIRKIDAWGNVTTVAGNGMDGSVDGTGGRSGMAQFHCPSGVAVGTDGTLYVADACGNDIRKIGLSGAVTTLAGNDKSGFADGLGGPNGLAEFNEPTKVAVDGAGNVYVADTGDFRIRRIDPAGFVTTLAGNGTEGSTDGTGGANGAAEFRWPDGVAVDQRGNVYVADLGSNRLRKIDLAGNVTTVAGDGALGWLDGPPGPAQFAQPESIAVDSQGTIYAADGIFGRVRRIRP